MPVASQTDTQRLDLIVEALDAIMAGRARGGGAYYALSHAISTVKAAAAEVRADERREGRLADCGRGLTERRRA
jgi:hypothetical protein